ncbi:hypothetical protein SAMN05421780_10547 [Flexibacter flexilis DSM 6793]|uniref:Neurotransmitter-gated ion-channel ligand binding domain-containing protein n=1 Tax=Flexibacter flexilis DSM 6793 TaxID=927664 RepID=A0A1I1IV55_9BACT|nr:hypothetical protein [Flexibacter flexilis]SFC38198.1 hypothetical protein SAMN05421780_10547 [Flexibacter flexilis DSM 6793]
MKRILLLISLAFFLLGKPNAWAAHDNHPDTVKVGCYIISLHDFDFIEEQYTTRFWLWMLHDHPIDKPSDMIELPDAKEYKIDNMMMDSLNGKGWLQLKIKSVMKQAWNLQNFPFDEQTLKIKIENPEFMVQDLIFVPDTLGKSYDPALEVDGWKIKSFHIDTGRAHYNTAFGDNTQLKPESDYAQFVVNITIKRDAWGLFFKLFLGMYVAFAISYVSFFIDPSHAEPRFGLPVGGLFAAVGNKYVIDSYLPETSTLTIVDTLHGLTFVMIFVIIAFSALSLRQDDDGQQKLSNATDRLVAWIVGGIYLAVNVVSVLMAL